MRHVPLSAEVHVVRVYRRNPASGWQEEEQVAIWATSYATARYLAVADNGLWPWKPSQEGWKVAD